MENLLTVGNTAAQYQSLSVGMIESYIAYIDRSERTVKGYCKNLKQFFAYLRFKGISKPIRQDVIDYRDYLLSEHKAIKLTIDGWAFQTRKNGEIKTIACKASTVKSYLQSVKSFFKWLSLVGYYPNIADNIHAPKVSTYTHKRDALTRDDVTAIEKSIAKGATTAQENASKAHKDIKGKAQRAEEQAKRLKAMYLLAVNAGLRTIEINRANIKDLEVKGGKAYIYIWGKGHSEADTKKALAKEVYEAIADYLAIRTDTTADSPLFVATGNRSKNKRIASTTISTMLKKAMVEAGYSSSRLTAHSLRHTTATTIQEMQGDIYTTQKYLRHASPATTEIYLHDENASKEAETAQSLYDYYHREEAQKQNLIELLENLNKEQIARLYKMAYAMQ